jgi:hypothetical protein
MIALMSEIEDEMRRFLAPGHATRVENADVLVQHFNQNHTDIQLFIRIAVSYLKSCSKWTEIESVMIRLMDPFQRTHIFDGNILKNDGSLKQEIARCVERLGVPIPNGDYLTFTAYEVSLSVVGVKVMKEVKIREKIVESRGTGFLGLGKKVRKEVDKGEKTVVELKPLQEILKELRG